MVLDEEAVIHPVELVAGKDQVFINIPFLEQPLVFAYSVCSAFKPSGTVGGLLSCEHLNKTTTEGIAEVVGLTEVTVQ